MKYAASHVLAVDPSLSPSLRGATNLIRGDAAIQWLLFASLGRYPVVNAFFLNIVIPANPGPVPGTCGDPDARTVAGMTALRSTSNEVTTPLPRERGAEMTPYVSLSLRRIARPISALPRRAITPSLPIFVLCKINNLKQGGG